MLTTAAFQKVQAILDNAGREGRSALLEPEGLAIFNSLGIKTPIYQMLHTADEADTLDLTLFPSDELVVKIVSEHVLHKSDSGGVLFVKKDLASVRQAFLTLQERFKDIGIRGALVVEKISYDPSLGGEILIGARHTDDFGPIVTFGVGGIYTEFLSANFIRGKDIGIFLPGLDDETSIRQGLENVAITSLLTGKLRGQKARIALEKVVKTIQLFLELAARFIPGRIAEIEVNPFVISGENLVPIDALVTLKKKDSKPAPAKPIEKIARLLTPKSVAVIGVSERMNPGRIILKNILREGFDPEHVFIIKDGVETIDGCRCVPDLAALPHPVDLFILSVSAEQVPGLVQDVIRLKAAESVIIIPGGLEEKAGTESLVKQMNDALTRSRESAWRGPVINGGNCLGIRSVPGHYDTMFIPGYKLPQAQGQQSPLAFISQSGAFAVSKSNKLQDINPRYSITLGNQMDLTVGDYFQYLKADPEVEIFAVYMEGFKELDGLAFLKAAKEIIDSGRTVIMYRAGRSEAGAKASQSHTASIAGDYRVTRALAEKIGVIVIEDLDDFEDMVRLFALLGVRKMKGLSLAAVSNAGFECVAIADNLNSFKLADFSQNTRDRLLDFFRKARIESIVDLHNPIDLTPMAGDEVYVQVIETILDDPGVDAVTVGCVPLTPALQTLPPGEGHHEDLYREGTIANLLANLRLKQTKPWIAIVDGGEIYDPFVHFLQAKAIPTFRTIDRAMLLFEMYCREMIKRETRKAQQ
ncbi:acetate--CoA ligase family protein [bacterium]|nr:acetate--CoA ligase family protein [bacterium]